MTGTVVHTAERRHHCDPGVTTRKIDHTALCAPPPPFDYALVEPTPWGYPAGTVWQCECGRTWVSQGSPAVNMPGVCTFRREGRFERRRRERR